MFTPEYLNELVESTNTAATDFSLYLSNKVIDSVVNLFEQHGEIKIIPSNVQRLKLLNEQSGILVADIEKEIRKRLPGLEKKIGEAFLQAGYEINEDINKSVADMVESDKELKDFIGKAPRLEHLTESEEKLLDAAYRRTRGEIRNLTCTTAADLNQQFVKSCDSAWWKATHGVDRNTAIREAIDEVSRYGTHVIYKNKNGKVRKMTVEAVTRMCVLTGINQANAEITLSHCVDMGMRTVLVSSHIGARYTDHDEPANHMSWQGKVYSLSDKLLKEYGYEEKKKNVFGKIKEFFQKFRKQQEFEDFETVTGYGTIEGLCGVNCRHTFHPFDPKGNSNPYKDYDNEENKRKYDLFQKQRAMERKIRETKKRLYNIRHAIKTLSDENAIAEMKLGELEAKTLFDKQYDAYSAFCKQNGLRRQDERLYTGDQKYDRIKVADFGRKQSAKANGAAKRNGDDKVSNKNSAEMFRKGSTYRRVENGIEIIDQPTYNKLINKVIRNGGKVYRGTDEIEQHLIANNASASTIGDTILFRKNATVSDVLEETYHFEQNLKKKNAGKSLKEQIILNEIEAKEYVLSCREKYHISEREVEQTKKQLESYRKELSDYYESKK